MAHNTSNQTSPISEITSEKASWTVIARVIRMWVVNDFNPKSPRFSVEMVLIDGSGCRIHATMKRTLLYKFRALLVEDKVYSFQNMSVGINGGAFRTTKHPFKLSFQFASRVIPVPGSQVRVSPFEFVPICDIVGGIHNTDFLVDVIGLLSGIGTEREWEKNGVVSKLNEIEIESDGHTIGCTLFGSYVDELNSFISAGDIQNVVVIIQLGKVKKFQDKIHIQNCMAATKLFFNLPCQEGTILKTRIAAAGETSSPVILTQITPKSRISPTDEFLIDTQRSTIQGLKDCDKASVFVVLGKITNILNEDSWWYTSCVCNKSVFPDSNMFFCKKCDKHVTKVFHRYCIKVRVMDNTDCATFAIFDKDATLMCQKSCAKLLEENIDGVLPREMKDLIEQEFIFKVDSNAENAHRFEASYRVKKVCTDVAIIREFKRIWSKEDAVFVKNMNENGSLSNVVVKDANTGSSETLSQEIVSLSCTPVEKGNCISAVAKCNEVAQDLMFVFSNVVNPISPIVEEVVHVSPTVEEVVHVSPIVEEIIYVSPTLDEVLHVSPIVDESVHVPHAVEEVVHVTSVVDEIIRVPHHLDKVIHVEKADSKQTKRASPNAESDDCMEKPLKFYKRPIKVEKP